VLVVGLLFAWREVQEMRRARYAQILIDLLLRWNEALLDARVAVSATHSPEELRALVAETARTGDPQYYKLVSVLVFFEDLALLTSHKIVNRDFVLDRFLFTLDEEYRRWGRRLTFSVRSAASQRSRVLSHWRLKRGERLRVGNSDNACRQPRTIDSDAIASLGEPALKAVPEPMLAKPAVHATAVRGEARLAKVGLA
jgi:hypothetical protein